MIPRRSGYPSHPTAAVRFVVKNLTKSVPHEYKKLIIKHLRPLGFTGFLLDELTPNRTRRALVSCFCACDRKHAGSLWFPSFVRTEPFRSAMRYKADA